MFGTPPARTQRKAVIGVSGAEGRRVTAAAHARQQRTRPVPADPRCRQAVAAARAVPAGRAGRHGRSHPRVTTGAILTVLGAVLWLGVHARIGALAVQTAGFVLLVAGLTWLLIPLPRKRSRVSRALDSAVDYLSFDPGVPAPRCPLSDLFEAAGPGE